MNLKRNKLYQIVKDSDSESCEGCILKHTNSRPIVIKKPISCTGLCFNGASLKPMGKWRVAELIEYIPIHEYLDKIAKKYRK